MIYYISDLHFFHEHIIKACNRPYKNLEDMHKDLIERWNEKVTDDDKVYILGDLSFKLRDNDVKDLIEIINNLNGEKHLIIGNHDVKWIKRVKFLNDNSNSRLPKINLYNDGVYEELNDNKRRVILFHYPIEDWNGKYHKSYHLFGHIHNADHNYIKQERRYNVGVDVNNFQPMTLDELINKNGEKTWIRE